MTTSIEHHQIQGNVYLSQAEHPHTPSSTTLTTATTFSGWNHLNTYVKSLTPNLPGMTTLFKRHPTTAHAERIEEINVWHLA